LYDLHKSECGQSKAGEFHPLFKTGYTEKQTKQNVGMCRGMQAVIVIIII
jgi:hypothetical protein